MERLLHLRVLTPAKTVLEAETGSVRLPLTDGLAGILPGHAPMLCALSAGELRCSVDGKTVRIRLSGGVAHVGSDLLTVLTPEAETVS